MRGKLVCCVSGYDIDPRPHGNSSGYHSDDASPTRKSETSPTQDFRMPGMLDGQENQSRKLVQPSDVIIMVKITLVVEWQRSVKRVLRVFS